MDRKTINDLVLKNKKVLIRVDFNVPILKGKVMSDKRIRAAIPTIKKVIKENGKIILFSHLGRIKTTEDKAKYSLKPVAETLSKLLNKKVTFVPETRGPVLEQAINKMKNKDILLVENTRFEDLNNKAESTNNPELAKYWASLGDVFINDAFGTAHRSHASNVGIAKNIKNSGIGYLIKHEIEMLKKGLDNPEHPFISIVGGAKVSDKIGVIKSLLKISDKILIGGAMAYTFLKSKGIEIGNSNFEEDHLKIAAALLSKGRKKILLPIDHAIAKQFKNEKRINTSDVSIPKDYMGLDVGTKTINLYKKAIKNARTIIWNGPLGVTEFSNFTKGTNKIAEAIANEREVFSIIGGGDSAAAAIKLGYEDKFVHISTGGGAFLTFVEGKELPGIEAIQKFKE